MRISINKKLISNKSLIDTITLKQEPNKEAPDEDYYVLYQDDNKIGYILLDNDYLDALFVYPEYRGKGFGDILIRKAINLGVTWLSVDPKNKIAINLYKKYGFKIDSFNDKNGYDEYIMKRSNIGDSMEKLKFNEWLEKYYNKKPHELNEKLLKYYHRLYLIYGDDEEELDMEDVKEYWKNKKEDIEDSIQSDYLKNAGIENKIFDKPRWIKVEYWLEGRMEYDRHYASSYEQAVDEVFGAYKPGTNLKLVSVHDSLINDVIKKEADGYVIYSKKGKKLSKPYKTKEEAEKRLKQIEYFKNTEDSMKLSKSVLEKQLKNVLRQYLLNEGYNDNDLEDYLVIDIKEIEDDGHKGIHVQIRNDLVGYCELPDEVASKLDKVVSQYDSNAYFEPYYSDTWDAYIWDQELITDSFAPLYIYQFPKDLRDEDLEALDKYHLEYIGHVSEEGDQPGDVLIKGTLDDLRDYCDSYLAYDLNDDYLYEVDEFDTDLITDSKHLEYEITKTPKGWYQVNFDGDVREFRTEKQAMEAIDEFIYPDIHKTRPELPENQRIETHRYIVGCINSADQTVEKMITATNEKQAIEKAKDKHDVVRVVYASLYDSKKIKDSKWVVIPNNNTRDCLNKYLELEGIYGFTDEIIDAWNFKEALIDDKLETFETSEEAVKAYLQWEGIIGYDEDIISILRGEDGLFYDEYAEEDNESEIDDTFVKDEKVRTSRGEFDLVDMTDEELRKEGYGMHHEENGIRVYTKNNQAVAIRVKDSKSKDSEELQNLVKECKDVVEKSLGKDDFRIYHKMDGQQNKIVLQASLDYEDTDTEDELIDKLTKIIEDAYPNSEFKYHDKFAGGYWILKE